jgi:F-type H+-transporting ATPase subunit delta
MQYSKTIIAKAFFELVKPSGVDAVNDFISHLEDFRVLSAKLKLNAVFKNPALTADDIKKILKSVCGSLKIGRQYEHLIETIVKLKALNMLGGIVSNLKKLRLKHFGLSEAVCASAAALDKRQITEVTELVKKISGCKNVILKEKIDRNVLGGVSLKVEDNLLDVSLRNKLNGISKIIS